MAYEAMISPENKIQIETDLLNHEIMRYRFRFGSQMILGRDECQAFCLNLFNPTEKQIKELGYESMEAFKACSEIGENRLARLLSCANASELG